MLTTDGEKKHFFLFHVTVASFWRLLVYLGHRVIIFTSKTIVQDDKMTLLCILCWDCVDSSKRIQETEEGLSRHVDVSTHVSVDYPLFAGQQCHNRNLKKSLTLRDKPLSCVINVYMLRWF